MNDSPEKGREGGGEIKFNFHQQAGDIRRDRFQVITHHPFESAEIRKIISDSTFRVYVKDCSSQGKISSGGVSMNDVTLQRYIA